jgi:glycosyltransferase involved in cell wall biosynthesis
VVIGRRCDIALFLPSLSGGGAERVMLTLAHGFAERSLSVDLLVACDEGSDQNRPPSSVRFISFGKNRTLASALKLAKYLREEKPDILLSTLDHANLVALWARLLSRTKVEVFVRVDNMVSSTYRHSRSLAKYVIPLLMAVFYPFADGVIAVSEAVADDLARCAFLSRRRIRRIYNPVDISSIEKRSKAPLDHPWLAQNRPPVILGVGRLTKQKNFAALLRAFREVRRYRAAKLIILGEGDDRAHLESLIDRYGLKGEVDLPGFSENPYAYMARSSVFAMSSLWEGFPVAVLEAMAVGLPVVAFNCPGGPSEILRSNGIGELVPVGDDENLAAAIIRILEEKGDSQKLKDRADHFRLDAILDEYLDLMAIRD